MGQPSDPVTELITLGRIGAAHGVKGWVRLISFTDPPENILTFRHIYLSPRAIIPGSIIATTAPEEIEIDESRAQGKHFVVHIRGCDDRDQAGLYTGRELQIEKSILPDLEAENFYWFELEGMQVINLQQENLGTVDHLMETGANDVLVVRSSLDSIDDQERLIPYVRDQVVKQVDLDKKIIQVDWQKDY